MRTEILGFKAPQKECTDKKCPFHGTVVPKEELFTGVVVRRDVNHSATIEWSRRKYVSKYERYESRRSRMRVHNPACLNAEIGSEVVAARTRPLSKTKNHVIISVGSKVDVVEQKVVDVKVKADKVEHKESKKKN